MNTVAQEMVAEQVPAAVEEPTAEQDTLPAVEPEKDTVVEEVVEEPVPSIDLSSPELYINRHLSHLHFNIRVLEQALDERYPLLERLQFLLIFSSNLDEFFEIKVAELQRQVRFGREKVGPDGLQPHEVLRRIREMCHEQTKRQYEILNDTLIPQLQTENIRFLRRREWTKAQREWIREYFFNTLMPVMTPIGLDPAHPFPRLVNKSLNFIVALEGKDAFGRDSGMAIIPAPRSMPRLIRLPDELCRGGDNLVFLSSVIHAFADELFPGMEVLGCYQFRLTRNADLDFDSEEVDDLARALKGELQHRQFGQAVRLEVADNCPEDMIAFLLKEFGLGETELYKVNGPVNLTRMGAVRELVNRSELSYASFSPGLPKRLRDRKSMFETLRQRDLLLQHPFESFTPVVDLLREAARDPKVLAVKQTLYRTGNNSEIVAALIEAARNGKEVTAVIEIRARFDEENNLKLASLLQEAGVVVVYGVVGYKTHAKIMMIVRQEDNELRRYVHLGTGNYHQGTARVYTDYSLLTADQEVGEDVHKIFQQLTGMGKILRLSKVLNAPFSLHPKMVEFILREMRHAQAGKDAHIIIKVNSMTEPRLIRTLYRASQAGVKIDLIVRGMCSLRPGVPGVSENIRVRSIIGRFLEHSRVCYFLNDGASEIYAASADWMERNMLYRVETCFPMEPLRVAPRVKKDLDLYLEDNTQAWELQQDGSYVRVQMQEGEEPISAQQILLERLAAAAN
ncbi:polyphosphate kinase 1 [Pokkaliibacter plantistimulans]|nr:polyphosphate kinase 1 [Pokkaliibacter plantistimulans]